MQRYAAETATMPRPYCDDMISRRCCDDCATTLRCF
jgi:hypothetical protein